MNINPIFRGDNTPQEQWSEREFDPQRGYIYYYDFHGLSQAQMITLQNNYSALGISSKIRLEKDTATLSVTDPTQTYVVDTWQVLSNDVTNDGLSNPLLLTYATLSLIDCIRQHISEHDPITAFHADAAYVNWNNTTHPTPSIIQIVDGFYSLQQRGSTEYRVAQYVLRHTTNAPNNWGLNVADIGPNTIYTPAQLYSEVANPALWAFPLPQRLITKIAYIPDQSVVFADGTVIYLWGWLKSPSTEHTSANNRVDIVTEYQLDLWATNYYEPYSSWQLPTPHVPWS